LSFFEHPGASSARSQPTCRAWEIRKMGRRIRPDLASKLLRLDAEAPPSERDRQRNWSLSAPLGHRSGAGRVAESAEKVSPTTGFLGKSGRRIFVFMGLKSLNDAVIPRISLRTVLWKLNTI